MINLSIAGVPDRLAKGSINASYTVFITAANGGLTLIDTIIITNTTISDIAVSMYIGPESDANKHIYADSVITANYFSVNTPNIFLKTGEVLAFKAASLGLNLLISGVRTV